MVDVQLTQVMGDVQFFKVHYQAFLGVLIDLIVENLGLIIKPLDNQTEIRNPVSMI